MNQNPTNNDHPESSPTSDTDAGTSSPSADRKQRSMLIPFAVVIILTMLSGIVHGVIDGRWSRQEDLIAIGDRLEELPETAGDWSMIESKGLDENAAKMLKCYGSQVRIYENKKRGEIVTVAVLFGPRGPIAVHTPEVCYSSVGTKQFQKRKLETIKKSGTDNSFWRVQFTTPPAPDPTLDVWYGWSDGNEWVAADNPRFWLTENLYKIQVAGSVGDTTFRPCKDFLRAFLPDLEILLE